MCPYDCTDALALHALLLPHSIYPIYTGIPELFREFQNHSVNVNVLDHDIEDINIVSS
jgi:hypothetical protein